VSNLTQLDSVQLVHAYKLAEYDIVTVGEASQTYDTSQLAAYVLPSNKELHMVFHSELMGIDFAMEGRQRVPFINKKWDLEDLREIIVRWQLYKRDEGFWNA
jgi:alpha-glucosidase